MHAIDDRSAFAPPPQPGLLRAFVLAVIAHLLLLLALTQGLQWQREDQNIAAEAELWAAVPQQAAPPEPVPVPPPPAPPVVRAPPEPERPVVKPPPEPPVQRDAEIALEREKQKRELEKRKLAEQEERERERAERRKAEAALKKKQEEAARRKEEQARQLAEAKRKEAAEQKRKEQEAREAREAREAKRLAQLREDNLRRMQGLAGTGAPGSTGTAARSSGPSASWGARVQARVKPNIVFSDDVSGNPEAVVEVRLAPDGTIVARRIKKSSGHRGWDEAVLRALDRTEVLPRDTDGRVPSGGDLVFRPRS